MGVNLLYNVLKIVIYFYLFKAHELILKDIMGYLHCNSYIEERKILSDNVPNTNLKFYKHNQLILKVRGLINSFKQ